jgi:hypothetical protein
MQESPMTHDHDTSALVQLDDGELMHGPTDRAAWITVLRGRAWVTQAHDLDDHFLGAGQSMHLAPGRRALIAAEGAVQLLVAKAPTRWRRVRRFTMAPWFRRLALP